MRGDDDGGAGGWPDVGEAGENGVSGSSGAAGGNGGSGGIAMAGMVNGRVFDARTLKPLAGVVVRVLGTSMLTNAHGDFELAAAAGDEVVVSFERDDYAPSFEPLRVLKGTGSYLQAYLLPVTSHGTLDAAKGGVIGSASAKIEVPASAFVDDAGHVVTGALDVSLTVLNPNIVDELMAFPGDFAAKSANGQEGLLQTFVPMDITVRKGGVEVALAKNKTIRVAFPVFDAAAAPPTIATWSLDETTGHWVEEGTAVLVVRDEGRVYETEIPHLSWWNCDAFRSTITCIRGCVTEDAQPAVGASVRARGISFANVGTATTSADGCFAEDVPMGGQLEVRAFNANGRSAATIVTAGNTPMRAGANPAACQDIGKLAIEPAASDCPAGYALCGADCADLSRDVSHCGACNTTCFGGGLEGGGVLGASCVGGLCTCRLDQTLCNNRCISTQNDRANCGSCNHACANGERCDAGQCLPIVCDPSLTLCANDCVDMSSNSSNCGACGVRCGGDGPNKGKVCLAGSCQCAAGTVECSGQCVNTSTDRNHCGSCSGVCATGMECTGGSCHAISCSAPNSTLCGNNCVDIQTNPSNCGACNSPCTKPGFLLCSQGVCSPGGNGDPG